MVRRYVFIILILAANAAFAQHASVVKFDRLQALLESQSDQIQVVNFWATWCGPCVKELPLFEALNSKKDSGVKVTLINLDYADQLEKVNRFLNQKKLRTEVLLLDEIDYNTWIDLVDKSWGGAIPATLVFNPKTGQRKFVDKPLAEGDLDKIIAALK